MTTFRLLAAILAGVWLLAGLSTRVEAAEKDLGHFGAWTAFAQEEGGQKVCYMTTAQTLKAAKVKRTQPPYLMITHRPVEASRDVFSYGAGVPLAATQAGKLRLDKQVFELFAVRDTAWARDALTDHAIARALLAAKVAQLTVIADQKGVPPIVDRFDVSGAAQAYRAIGVACGLIEEAPKAVAPPTKIKKATPKAVKPQSAAVKKATVPKTETKKATAKKQAVTEKKTARPAAKTQAKTVTAKTKSAPAAQKQTLKKTASKKSAAKKVIKKTTKTPAKKTSPKTEKSAVEPPKPVQD